MTHSKAYNRLFHESHSWKKLMVFSSVLITPELASELLGLNKANRPLKQALIDRYVTEMKAGKWRTNGDNIRISKTGNMLDGQHRCHAVVISKVSVTQNIATGLEDEVFDTIDNGRSRSAGDALAVLGHKNYTTMAGAAKVIMSYFNGELSEYTHGGQDSRRYTNHDVVEYVENHTNIGRLNECCVSGGKCNSKFGFYSSATYAAFLYMFGEYNRELAKNFMELLITGEDISKTKCSPIYLLRKKFIDASARGVKLPTMDKYAYLIKAWNAFGKGKEIGALSYGASEKFPKIEKPTIKAAVAT